MTTIHELINDAYRKHLQSGADFGLDFRWITGHSAVEWNEMADVEAKEASGGKVSRDASLPPFPPPFSMSATAPASFPISNDSASRRSRR
ncbi:hypothetical protein BDV98DRAFT_575154 [Pterulicium gracile]|uniref:Uncharacterized protein n=1 Tax=Pterulicium gracile TaxID=1884261 RepID=A0A5C3Q7R5_9AGAR|nr:hypothetical protein BDV98DRAFT_575154 [Pterula gracilis]